MEERNDGKSMERTALGLIKIVQSVSARRRESRLRQSQLPRGLSERRGRIGTRQHNSHQADVLRSRQRYLYGNANLPRVKRNALGDHLCLRVSRVVTQLERGLRRSCEHSL